MKTTWVAGCSSEQAQIVRSDFKSSFGIRKRLSELLEDKIFNSLSSTRKKENYALASWSYLQADAIGYERALSEVISLILDQNVE